MELNTSVLRVRIGSKTKLSESAPRPRLTSEALVVMPKRTCRGKQAVHLVSREKASVSLSRKRTSSVDLDVRGSGLGPAPRATSAFASASAAKVLFPLSPNSSKSIAVSRCSDQSSPKPTPLIPEDPNLLHDYSRQQNPPPAQENSEDIR